MAKEKEGKVIIYVDWEKIPVRSTPQSQGIDLYASENISIGGNSVGVVGLGIKMNFNALVAARSSIRKHWVMLANWLWVIDEDYRGEVKAPLFNFKPYNVNISKGDKLCQIILPLDEEVEIRAVSQEEFDNRWVDNPTQRGEGWIGSTDNEANQPTQEQIEEVEQSNSDDEPASPSDWGTEIAGEEGTQEDEKAEEQAEETSKTEWDSDESSEEASDSDSKAEEEVKTTTKKTRKSSK